MLGHADPMLGTPADPMTVLPGAVHHEIIFAFAVHVVGVVGVLRALQEAAAKLPGRNTGLIYRGLHGPKHGWFVLGKIMENPNRKLR